MDILVLGHKGMLGNAIRKYFNNKLYSIDIISDLRWDSDDFKKRLKNSDAEYIINAIGAIPQKKYNWEEYLSLNVNLPLFLDTLGKKVIYPSSDCEFSGNLEHPNKYKKLSNRDTNDNYGKSKALASLLLEDFGDNTKIIRTSVIGHELNEGISILDWFLKQKNDISGYVNYYWNGVTSLYWCELVERIICNWCDFEKMIQVGTEGISKRNLLMLFKEIYGKSTKINNFELDEAKNFMLESDFEIPSIEKQIINLKNFYNK